MKLYNFLIIGFLVLASNCNNVNASDASSSSDPYKDFVAADFVVRPLKEISGRTDFLAVETVTALKEAFRETDNVGVVIRHPFGGGKMIQNYAPPRPTVGESHKQLPFDTMVISRYATGELPDTLTSWVQKGLSTHIFLQLDGRIVFWVDSLRCKGQMAGTWNNHALEILAETNGSQTLNTVQIVSLENLVIFANAHGENIKCLLSYGEACGSGSKGAIANIASVRKELKLSDDNKKHEQTLLSVIESDEEKAQVRDKTGGQAKKSSWCVVQ